MRGLLRFLPLLAFLVVLLLPRLASAYPWMIRHEYNQCSTCHLDPSGGFLLNDFGHVESEKVLRTTYGEPPKNTKLGKTLFGLIDLPKGVYLGATGRSLVYVNKPSDAKTQLDSVIPMQFDLRGEVHAGAFRAAGSIGYNITGGSLAALYATTKNSSIVSREHWVGAAFGEKDEFLVRGGRMNLPFGLRILEHTMYVRAATRTDIKDAQQDGVAFSYAKDEIRAEIMGIAGNYQISPDRFRERGYAGYFEYLVTKGTAVGVSSMVTHAKEDILVHATMTRQAHGLFARISPVEPLVFLLEGDYVAYAPKGSIASHGFAAMLQADVEPTQGIHVQLTGDFYRPGGDTTGTSANGWLSLLWFFVPHADARVDLVRGRTALGTSSFDSTTLLFQLHGTL